MSELQGLDFQESTMQIKSLLGEVQNCVMSMRMIPLNNTFQKMNRIVFDLSRKLGKDVEFVMNGQDTELDRNIVEHIADPLMHLVRNAVDHGVEAPIDRLIVGKTDKARVMLSAKLEDGMVWITVEDDGRGLNRQQILERAHKQGLIDGSKLDDAYTDAEVYQLITLPGFSTKEEVTEYSGRGVGLDVVLENIAAIGGSLEIESNRGRGSSMTMKIPLTYAIVDGMVTKLK